MIVLSSSSPFGGEFDLHLDNEFSTGTPSSSGEFQLTPPADPGSSSGSDFDWSKLISSMTGGTADILHALNPPTVTPPAKLPTGMLYPPGAGPSKPVPTGVWVVAGGAAVLVVALLVMKNSKKAAA